MPQPLLAAGRLAMAAKGRTTLLQSQWLHNVLSQRTRKQSVAPRRQFSS